MYLGDGCISRTGRTLRLRITLDASYPGIIEECRRSVASVIPQSRVSIVKRCEGAVDVSSYSILCPDLIPQHGSGPKHLRPIVLDGWQRDIVVREPRRFLKGLFDSDGCYFLNRVRAPSGTEYVYDRYMFSNMSSDISDLFSWTCSLIGVHVRRSNRKNLSRAVTPWRS